MNEEKIREITCRNSSVILSHYSFITRKLDDKHDNRTLPVLETTTAWKSEVAIRNMVAIDSD